MLYIPQDQIPVSRVPLLQHVLDIYASETNKSIAVWSEFTAAELDFRLHPKSASVREIFRHQLLSERRFFAEFLGCPEPAATSVLPDERADAAEYCARLREFAGARLGFLADREQEWWLESVPFFDVERQRIWIFWRRVLHTAHHRTQLTVYLRMLEKPVPPTYGPTADVTWAGADATQTVEAATRK